MFPKLFDLPLSDFPYLIEIRVKPGPRSCVWVGDSIPSRRLEMKIEMFPQPHNLITAGEVWYSLLWTTATRCDTITRRCTLI